MLSRRAWLSALAAGPAPCFTVCGLDGRILQQSTPCGPRPPGSTVKPLLAGLMHPSWRFACLRELRVGGRRLDCVHTPIQGPLDLETALAASCNSWFAQAAQRLDGVTVHRTLREAGGMAVNIPRTREELLLIVLGLEGVRFTSAALARAYASLRREASAAVRRGLEAAVTYGTAADPAGRALLAAGKTGTVREGAWFAGWSSRVAIAVFVAGGTGGADAAPAARKILERWHTGSPA